MAEVDSPLWADYVSQSERAQQKKNDVEVTRKSNDELDKNAFLMLLITQMRYQDPLNPVEDKEFISQMAQFSSLEQMQNLNQTMSNSQTFALVGKYVYANLYNSQTGTYSDVYGRVDSVIMRNKIPYLVVDDVDVPMSDVVNVFEDEYQLSMERAAATNAFTAQNVALIGKYIQAITKDSEGNANGFVEGKVDNVKVVGGTPILVVGNKDVYPTELISISDKEMLIGKTIKVAETITEGSNEDEDVEGIEETAGVEDAEAVEDGEEGSEDSETVTKTVYHDRIVMGVEIDGDTAKLVLDNGSKIEIEKIDSISEALKFVNKKVKTKDTEGVVAGVFIKNREPYMLLEDETTIPFSQVIR